MQIALRQSEQAAADAEVAMPDREVLPDGVEQVVEDGGRDVVSGQRRLQRRVIAARAGVEDVALDRAGQGGGEGVAEGEVGVGRLLPGLLPHAAVGRVEEALRLPCASRTVCPASSVICPSGSSPSSSTLWVISEAAAISPARASTSSTSDRANVGPQPADPRQGVPVGSRPGSWAIQSAMVCVGKGGDLRSQEGACRVGARCQPDSAIGHLAGVRVCRILGAAQEGKDQDLPDGLTEVVGRPQRGKERGWSVRHVALKCLYRAESLAAAVERLLPRVICGKDRLERPRLLDGNFGAGRNGGDCGTHAFRYSLWWVMGDG